MRTDKTAAPWLLSRPDDSDTIRLFCFPYAGGGASAYRGWEQTLPGGTGVYPIQPPSRENRIAEKPLREMGEMAEAISEAIAPYLRRPFILFGHSLGARIAFEVARNLRRRWDVLPSLLIVSGSRAPHIPEPKPLHHLPDEEFMQELRRFSGTPEALLQSKELMDIFIPILRADFAVDETYVYSADEPLACPISAFGGTEDPEASREELEAWAVYTTGDFTLEMIEGDHFFLKKRRDDLLRSISRIIVQNRES